MIMIIIIYDHHHEYDHYYDGQVSHTLEEESPLFNFTPGQLLKAKMELIVCLEVLFIMIMMMIMMCVMIMMIFRMVIRKIFH